MADPDSCRLKKGKPKIVRLRRVAEKNGMIAEKEIIFRGFPTNVFALTRERWEKIRGA